MIWGRLTQSAKSLTPKREAGQAAGGQPQCTRGGHIRALPGGRAHRKLCPASGWVITQFGVTWRDRTKLSCSCYSTVVHTATKPDSSSAQLLKSLGDKRAAQLYQAWGIKKKPWSFLQSSSILGSCQRHQRCTFSVHPADTAVRRQQRHFTSFILLIQQAAWDTCTDTTDWPQRAAPGTLLVEIIICATQVTLLAEPKI